MKGSKFQILILVILMLALVMRMEGMLPNLFAANEEPILLVDEIDGMEFKAQIDKTGFNFENEIVIKTIITNKSNLPKSYYTSNASNGVKEVLGATLVSMDKKSSFTDKFQIDAAKSQENAMALERSLESGQGLICDFYMLPFYKENGRAKRVTPGKYMLSLWYKKDHAEIIKAEFPVTIKKSLNKMHIKF